MITERRNIKIGGIDIDAWYTDSPGDGYEYTIEIFTDEKLKNRYYSFNLMCLNGVSSKELPTSCKIFFVDPKTEFHRISSVSIKSNKDGCELEITMFIDFRYWEMKESVASFCDRLYDAIKNSKKCRVVIDKDEYGYYIKSIFNISDSSDIYQYYSIEKSSKNYGEGKMHWWIRYVLVPLAGSEAIATVLAKYILK